MQVADKNVKIKPPLTTENHEVAALKAELELELKNKKQCAYQPFECTHLTVDGYKYCSKHILQDKSAPFKQCSFVYTSNGKRCHFPAPKNDKKDFGYCTEHSLKTTLSKNRQNSRYPPPQTAEVALCSLSQYLKKPRSKTLSSGTDEGGPSEDIVEQTFKNLDPFKDIDANKLYNSACKDVLDLCSESDSDVEASNFASIWLDAQADSSDNESADSEQEDTLKNANVYTAEEITLITRDKLIKLQSLYIEQYRHLQHILKEKKRKYYHSLKREKETCCNINNQIRENPKEQRLYKKLKAYNKYHRTHGVEAVLNKRLHDLRAKITDGIPGKSPNYTKCMFTEGGVKCGERTLPLAKYCRKHILEDPNQVLFRACGKIKADMECTTPIEVVFEDATCRLHMEIPTIKSYSQLRKNSESDFDDSLDISDISALPGTSTDTDILTTSTKSELIDYKPSIMDTLPSELFEDDDKQLKIEEENSVNFSVTNSESCESTELKQEEDKEYHGREYRMEQISLKEQQDNTA